ncbi:MAG: hypothetical protein CVU91_03955 [Firmicutes bacterium HGW-Firmicutes-16]|nr:MAG: hypothetical protein CVU91_03955 [Firmicutes bacterium HGW-Firmicutes-16]
MKRLSLILLAFCITVGAFSGCTQKAKPTEYDLKAIAAQLQESGAFSDFLSPITKVIAESFYGFEDADVTECVVYCSTGATTEEIALFKCANEEAATKLKANAEKRTETQKAIYESYAPKEPPKLDDAIVTKNGLYVFYIVSDDSAKAQAVLDNQN